VSEPTTTGGELVPAGPEQAQPFAVVCAACGRERTLADDYDYNPLQLVTGRPLGWFNCDGEQMCGQCLLATMKGQIP
jgi:hypothetical protein